MDEQKSIESGQAAPSRILGADSQVDIPTLLGIPPEIRDQIYSYFVTIDQNYEHRGDTKYAGESIDVTILHINRKIREEAWDSLIRTNLWVRVTHPEPGLLGFFNVGCINMVPQSYIPCNKVSEEHLRRLIAKAEIHLMLDSTDEDTDDSDIYSSESSEPFLFAYHPFHYNLLLQRLTEEVLECDSITVQMTPSTLINSSLFAKLLEPLCVLRDLRHVSFDGVEDCPALQSLQQDMQHPLFIRNEEGEKIDVMEIIKIQQYHQRLGRNAELRGHYSDAMCHYQVGRYARVMFPYDVGRLDGSPEYNTCCQIATELGLGYSRSLHRYMIQLEKSVLDGTLKDYVHSDTIRNSIDACCDALNFIGITDCQRREAHLYRAFALFRVAEYLRVLPERDRNSSPYVPDYYYNYYRPVLGKPHKASSEAAFAAAARDLFYAKNVTPSHDILEDLKVDDNAIYRRLDCLTGHEFPIAKHEVPPVGYLEWRSLGLG
ncbi:hypothetical protein PG985_013634 [Apiospora marii]|uniref:uncharacterized protein n=1 Tax=Apiospora marii TaxID=335849 RepID=UPI00312DE032